MARRRRTTPEWLTLTTSSVVLAVVVALLVAQIPAGGEPPRPRVREVAPVESRGGAFHVPVVIHNDGGRAAANVQVNAELVIAGETVETDQVIDFLGADETEDLVFVFAADPAAGALAIEVNGFADP